MKKGIFLVLIALASPIYASAKAEDSIPVSVEALLWKTKVGSAENWAQSISPAGNTRTTTLIGVPFKWSPGLRISSGHYNPKSNLDVMFSYTGFQTKGRNAATITNGGLYSAFLGNFYVNNAIGGTFGPN